MSSKKRSERSAKKGVFNKVKDQRFIKAWSDVLTATDNKGYYPRDDANWIEVDEFFQGMQKMRSNTVLADVHDEMNPLAFAMSYDLISDGGSCHSVCLYALKCWYSTLIARKVISKQMAVPNPEKMYIKVPLAQKGSYFYEDLDAMEVPNPFYHVQKKDLERIKKAWTEVLTDYLSWGPHEKKECDLMLKATLDLMRRFEVIYSYPLGRNTINMNLTYTWEGGEDDKPPCEFWILFCALEHFVIMNSMKRKLFGDVKCPTKKK